MTIIRTGLIAALGLWVAGMITPAAAAPSAASVDAVADAGTIGALHLVGNRGSWIEPKHSRRDYHFDDRRHFDRYDDHYNKKRYSKKKKRKAFKRGYSRGYDRGYEEGYYEARKRSFHKRRGRHHHHHYYPGKRFRGGIYFGDGHFGRGDFRFRY
jgi:hypothetical protein